MLETIENMASAGHFVRRCRRKFAITITNSDVCAPHLPLSVSIQPQSQYANSGTQSAQLIIVFVGHGVLTAFQRY